MMTLSRSDADLIMESREQFKQMGFDYDMIGNREIALRSVPAFLDSGKSKEMLLNLLVIFNSELPRTDEAVLLALSTAACKAAVKAHDRLDALEVKKLIDDLVLLENPFHCPHGRPIIVRYSKKDLEKEFKRII
jgi:DNA mismatch repair protein MutL